MTNDKVPEIPGVYSVRFVGGPGRDRGWLTAFLGYFGGEQLMVELEDGSGYFGADLFEYQPLPEEPRDAS